MKEVNPEYGQDRDVSRHDGQRAEHVDDVIVDVALRTGDVGLAVFHGDDVDDEGDENDAAGDVCGARGQVAPRVAGVSTDGVSAVAGVEAVFEFAPDADAGMVEKAHEKDDFDDGQEGKGQQEVGVSVVGLGGNKDEIISDDMDDEEKDEERSGQTEHDRADDGIGGNGKNVRRGFDVKTRMQRKR